MPTTAIRPGRVRLEHTRSHLEMVTIQHRAVADTVERDGVVYPNLERSDYADVDEFVAVYRWLAKRLADTCTTHPGFDPGNGAMFWLWARTTRPTLVAMADCAGGDHVLMQVRVPRERVLLSDFDAYHGPLNGGVAYSAVEVGLLGASLAHGADEYFTDLEHELAAAYGPSWRHHRLTPEDRARVEATWGHILVADPTHARYVQACVAHLEAGDVVDILAL